MRERQETVRDSRTGKESVTVTRNIGDRVRSVAKREPEHDPQGIVEAVMPPQLHSGDAGQGTSWSLQQWSCIPSAARTHLSCLCVPVNVALIPCNVTGDGCQRTQGKTYRK